MVARAMVPSCPPHGIVTVKMETGDSVLLSPALSLRRYLQSPQQHGDTVAARFIEHRRNVASSSATCLGPRDPINRAATGRRARSGPKEGSSGDSMRPLPMPQLRVLVPLLVLAALLPLGAHAGSK